MNNELANTSTKGLAALYPTKSEYVSKVLVKAEANLAYVAKGAEIFSRSHSNVAWFAHVINNDSPLRNISQISAELKQKRNALVEAKHEYKSRIVKAKALREKAKYTDVMRPEEKAEIIAEAEKWEAFTIMMQEGIIGATKDIEDLTAGYKEFEKIIIEKHGKFDEEVFELEEREYWPQQLIRQSMRDVRQYGIITKGEQEALENIGLDPAVILAMIKSFLAEQKALVEKGEAGVSSEMLDTFIKQCGIKFGNCHDEKMKRRGLDEKIKTDYLYLEGKNDC